MSNRRLSILERLTKPKAKRCPKCGGQMVGKNYSDAWLYICSRCEFPIRVKK